MKAHSALVSSSVLALCFAAPPLLAQGGDYNGDGYDDLAVPVPFEDIAGLQNTGSINLIYGTRRGLRGTDDQVWNRFTPGVLGSLRPYAYFSHAVASGDFNGDGFGDLAASSPHEDVGSTPFAGTVNVLYGSAIGITSANDQRWHRNVPGVVGSAVPYAYFGWSLAAGDFDGDGFDDLAIGNPYERVGDLFSAGTVHVLYGSPQGLRAAGDRRFTQDTAGVLDGAEDLDLFGWSLIAGDFDGDGRDDLAIGIPGEDIDQSVLAGDPVREGAVAVLYGSSNGLTPAGDQFWHQDSLGEDDPAESNDLFGYALAAGDFDGDGREDLAVGIPNEDIIDAINCGAVAVIYGTGQGLRAIGSQFFHQDSPGILNQNDGDEEFGRALVAGDFDDDGRDDLAIGVPFESLGQVQAAGAVTVLYGSGVGLRAVGDEFLHQNVPGVKGVAEFAEAFGTALFAGDFDGDGHDDLGVSAPFEVVGEVFFAGSVTVFHGVNSGLSVFGEQVWTQDSAGIRDQADDLDSFGAALIDLGKGD